MQNDILGYADFWYFGLSAEWGVRSVQGWSVYDPREQGFIEIVETFDQILFNLVIYTHIFSFSKLSTKLI